LVRIVSRREQQNPEDNGYRERRVNIGFRIVQRERELAADAVKIRKQQLCLVHWKYSRLVFGWPPAALAIGGEASESVTRAGAAIRNHGDRFAPSIATATAASEQIPVSRAKPLRGAEGALDAVICSEKG
jgi:hypothetical protein